MSSSRGSLGNVFVRSRLMLTTRRMGFIITFDADLHEYIDAHSHEDMKCIDTVRVVSLRHRAGIAGDGIYLC